MSVNIEELRRLASEATPGPWHLALWTTGERCAEVMTRNNHRVVCDATVNDSGYIAYANPATIIALLDELERVKAQSDTYLNLLSEVAYEVESLISESYGVAGLHLNGDVAPWHEIEAGGQYERLTNLPLAIEAARTAKEPQP